MTVVDKLRGGVGRGACARFSKISGTKVLQNSNRCSLMLPVSGNGQEMSTLVPLIFMYLSTANNSHLPTCRRCLILPAKRRSAKRRALSRICHQIRIRRFCSTLVPGFLVR